MASPAANALLEHLNRRVGDRLRMIATYDRAGYEVAYLRDDVDHDVDLAIEDHRLEALSRGHFERLFGHGRGELSCIVKCFEETVEMNIPLSKTHGIGVSIDAEALTESKLFVGECRDVVAPYAELTYGEA